MYVERVPNRNSPPAVLLRESFRADGKVKKRTIANLSDWPEAKIEALRRLLRDEPAVSGGGAGVVLRRSLPHGHIAAALGLARRLGLARLIAGRRAPSRLATLALAMVVARVIEPASKLATARRLDTATASSSLGTVLGLGAVAEKELYAALDWLGGEQARIEAALAKRHLSDGTLVLYDLTSAWFEGRCCPLAQLGYSRDGRRGKKQIVFGLLCSADGCPVAVEAFAGNVGDPSTLPAQVEKLKQRFGLGRIVLVGDRGMITNARLDATVKPAGLDWITCLRAPAVQNLLAGGAFQLDLFDDRDLAEISAPDFPGERLVVCRNPALAEERRRKREELLAATEKELARIAAAVTRPRAPLRERTAIALKAGAVLNRYRVAKHFKLDIRDRRFAFARNAEAIAAEAALDGIYVIRTSVPAATLAAPAVVAAYKRLALVERAFRSLKTVDLEVRPIHHRLADRVRAHLFLCLLAFYLEWHMREALRPILFDEHDREAAAAARVSIVAPAQRSPAAMRKAQRKRTEDGLPVHSFRSLLADLATLTRNQMELGGEPPHSFALYAELTSLQARAFELLAVKHKL
jgi:hypothetical protein